MSNKPGTIPDCDQLRADYTTHTMRELQYIYRAGWQRIKNALLECGIEARPQSDSPGDELVYRDPAWLLEKRAQGLTYEQMGALAGVSARAIARWMSRAMETAEKHDRFIVYSRGNGYPFYSGAEVTRSKAVNGPEGMRLLSSGMCFEVRGSKIVSVKDFRRIKPHAK